VRWLNRVTYGIDGATVAQYQALGRKAFLEAKLRGGNDNMPAAALTNLDLIKHTVSDQRMTVSVPPTLSEQQFRHNIEFELKFSQEVGGIAYRDAIDPRWLVS